MDRFDKILWEDLSPESSWSRLGKGSFGYVYKGEYLGLEVAIKEVIQSSEYDVDKYFQRECKIMQESRHPNIVQYLGLCLAPSQSQTSRRILIISEYLPHGNLRSYIHSTSSPFPWRLRLSFAIDVTRAVAYLHRRNCLHRDLKGENLLITENERIKVCDFGFARIAAKTDEEMRRMSYCGTDGYMAPEILMGDEFGLPADIFSLGVIFCEILSRKLVDSDTFKRDIPSFTIPIEEIVSQASPSCPDSFIKLAISCVSGPPTTRPVIGDILTSLRQIELEVLEMESRLLKESERGSWNVGTLSFVGSLKGLGVPGMGGKRPTAPRLPSFEGRVTVGSSILNAVTRRGVEVSEDDDKNIEEIATANVRVGKHGIGGSEDDHFEIAPEDVFTDDYSGKKAYSTEVIGRRSDSVIRPSYLDSTITVKASPTKGSAKVGSPTHVRLASSASISSLPSLPSSWLQKHHREDSNISSIDSFNSSSDVGENSPYHTMFPNQPMSPVVTPSALPKAQSQEAVYFDTVTTNATLGSEISEAGATIDHSSRPSELLESSEEEDIFHSTIRSPPSAIRNTLRIPSNASVASTTSIFTPLHRFSIIKPGVQKYLGSLTPYSNSPSLISYSKKQKSESSVPGVGGLGKKNGEASKKNSLDLTRTHSAGVDEGGMGLLWPGGLLTKCEMCEKRLGLLKSFLECDDCGFRCHIRCSDLTLPSCRTEEAADLTSDTPPYPSRAPPPTPSIIDAGTPTSPQTESKDSIKTHSSKPSKLLKKRPASASGKGSQGRA